MRDNPTISPAGYCDEANVWCRCAKSEGHDNNHICECEGSWDQDGNIVTYPDIVITDNGPYPKGTRISELKPEEMEPYDVFLYGFGKIVGSFDDD